MIEAVNANEKSDLEIQDELDLERLTDAFLEEALSKPGDEEKDEGGDEEGDDDGTPDVDEDGRVNEDLEWDGYLPKDDTGKIEREIRQKEPRADRGIGNPPEPAQRL